MAYSIPIEVLIKIERHRPDLAAMIHDLVATDDQEMVKALEKRLALSYTAGMNRLTAEETLMLSACCRGKAYGEVDLSQLH